MTPDTSTLTLFSRTAFALAAFIVTMMPCRAQAQAVLNPGVIKGNIAVIGETVTQATVTADWTDPATGTKYSAHTTISGAGNYSLTVNVPGSVTANYKVSVTVRLSGAQSALALPDQFAAVTAFHETVADFVVVPGYITATVTPTSGSLTSLFLTAFGSGGGAAQGSGPGASITFPVLADPAVSVFGTAIFTTGFANLASANSVSGGGRDRVRVVDGHSARTARTGRPHGDIRIHRRGAGANQHQRHLRQHRLEDAFSRPGHLLVSGADQRTLHRRRGFVTSTAATPPSFSLTAVSVPLDTRCSRRAARPPSTLRRPPRS